MQTATTVTFYLYVPASATFNPASPNLQRFNGTTWSVVSGLADDGAHQDGGAGDRIYGMAVVLNEVLVGPATFRASVSYSGQIQRAYSNTLTIEVVGHAKPVITWANPADIVYGTALSGTQLNATANVPGSFVYTPAEGTVLNAGPGQTLTVNFTPTDTANYDTATVTTSLSVQPAPLTITAEDKTKLVNELILPTLTAQYVGLVNGDTPSSLDQPVLLSTTATSLSPPGAYVITAGGAQDANYDICFVNGTLTVPEAGLTLW